MVCQHYRVAHTSGSALTSGFLLASPQKKPKGLAPTYGPSFAGVPSLHHCSEGTPRRAIPGPSRLSRHPCRSTLSTTIPFGLLKGRLASPANFWHEKHQKGKVAERPLPPLCSHYSRKVDDALFVRPPTPRSQRRIKKGLAHNAAAPFAYSSPLTARQIPSSPGW